MENLWATNHVVFNKQIKMRWTWHDYAEEVRYLISLAYENPPIYFRIVSFRHV